MEYSEVIRRRRMVRDYLDEPLPPGAEARILASALRAPSAGFSQGWAFLALSEEADRRRFWTNVPGSPEGMQRAPLVVVTLSHKDGYLDRYAEPDKGWTDRSEARWPAPYWDIDTGMAALLMLLTAVDEGLGACFFGIEPAYLDGLRADFGVPAAYLPIGAVSVGRRPAQAPVQGSGIAARRRRPEDVIHHGAWGRHRS